MSLTPVTQNFVSVTCCVFRDRVVFRGGASLPFALSECFRVREAMTRRRENVHVCPALVAVLGELVCCMVECLESRIGVLCVYDLL